ncbi:HD domain-containing protein [Nocardia sp. NPDC020380]|uniref:HD domain-containing protein n=1 Tax=Nocardia sp. NPDC020380 TaxID=3364309 RepID=UPI003797135F
MSVTADLCKWAADLAREQLEELPRRWKHTQGVARQAEHARGVVDDPDLLVAAAWLHDIGYAPDLVQTGVHAVDGAQFLAGLGVSDRLCGLVANHSCACVEARHQGVMIRWPDERTALRDALWWADMTTTPNGAVVDVQRRINEVFERYGPNHVVTRSVAEASDALIAAANRTERLLADPIQV